MPSHSSFLAPTTATVPERRIGVLITGVNPFEDVPGYHFYSMIVDDPRFRVEVGDDSAPATALIRSAGTAAHDLKHPGPHLRAFNDEVLKICEERNIGLLVPGADAHLFAFAQSPPLAARCLPARWLLKNQIRNKWDLQDWLSRFFSIPSRQKITTDLSAPDALAGQSWPVVVKGFVKGAGSCDSQDEVTATIKTLLKNPANQGDGGGVYLEEWIDGEEFCVLILKSSETESVLLGIRKLAVSATGTTLAATVDYSVTREAGIAEIAGELHPGMAMELELRRNGRGESFVFEANLRFPSWISALEGLGPQVFAISLLSQVGSGSTADLELPPQGTTIYRLPQSGYLSPDQVFSRRRKQTPSLLWPWASPQQFRVK